MTCEAKITQRTKQHHPYTFSEGGRRSHRQHLGCDAVPFGHTQMPVPLPPSEATATACREEK
jgi:hypothetical protein